jgi:hypothetical protein
MANYKLRFANRSNAVQDWMIYRFHSFQLNPNYVQSSNVTIHHNYTYQIVVSTDGGYAHVDLIYNSVARLWSIQTNTPNEWQLAQGNNIVTLRCLLKNVELNKKSPSYSFENTPLENKSNLHEIIE